MILQTIEADGRQLALWREEGDGPPLLWIHGYTLDASLWAPIWAALPNRTHIGLDLPGHGASNAYRPGDSMADSARVVLSVADAIGADEVIAMSFGATVTLLAAAEAPYRFRRLVLAAPALPGGPEDQSAADCNQELLRLNRERGHGPWLSARWLAEPPMMFSGARRDAALFASIAAVVARHRWDELALPAFAGAADPMLRRKLARIAFDLENLIRMVRPQTGMAVGMRRFFPRH